MKGRIFGTFQHPFCRKTPKKIEGRLFGGKKIERSCTWEPVMKKNEKKSLTMPKKSEREDPLGFFNIHSVAKLQKN